MRTPPVSPRRRRRLGRGALAVGIWALLAVGGVSVPSLQAVAEPVRVAQASASVSLAQATQMVREQTGGQVLRAETKRDKGRAVHRIRVLTDDGRVRTWHVDAETGRIY
jgi:hypothetical protein